MRGRELETINPITGAQGVEYLRHHVAIGEYSELEGTTVVRSELYPSMSALRSAISGSESDYIVRRNGAFMLPTVNVVFGGEYVDKTTNTVKVHGLDGTEHANITPYQNHHDYWLEAARGSEVGPGDQWHVDLALARENNDLVNPLPRK